MFDFTSARIGNHDYVPLLTLAEDYSYTLSIADCLLISCRYLQCARFPVFHAFRQSSMRAFQCHVQVIHDSMTRQPPI